MAPAGSRPRRDLRLLPAALGTYLGCWCGSGPVARHATAAAIGGGGLLLLVVLAGAVRLAGVRPSTREGPVSLPVLPSRHVAGRLPRRDRSLKTALTTALKTALTTALMTVLVAAGGLGAGLAVGALHAHPALAGPLPALVRTHAVVSVTGQVGEAQLVGGRVHGDRRSQEVQRVALRLQRLTADGRAWRLEAAVTVLASGRWPDLPRGSTVRLAGRLEPSSLHPEEVVLRARRPPQVLAAPSALHAAVDASRLGMRRAVASLPPGPRGLLPGLVLGDTSGLDPLLQAHFRSTGLTHLVAVSGGNLAIVSGTVLVLLLFLGVGRRPAVAVAALALAAYVLVVGPDPSVLRAAAMAAVAILALLLGRGRDTVAALLAAATVLLLVDPALSRTYGFVLSVLATGGLLLWSGPWTRRLAAFLRRWLPPGGRLSRAAPVVAAAVAVPAAAQLAVAPVLVLLQPSLSLVSVPANLVAAVAVAPATLLGLTAVVLAPLSLPAAEAAAWCAQWPADVIIAAATTGAQIPGSTLPWVPGPVGAVLLTAVLVLVALAARATRRPRVRSRIAPMAAVAVPLAVVIALASLPLVTARNDRPWPPSDWSLIACDIGQGDGLLVRTGENSVAVVDTGPDPAAMQHCLEQVAVPHISLLLLTHMHADHVEGVPGVLRVARPEHVLVGPLDEPASEGSRVQRWLAAEHLRPEPAPVGERLVIGTTTWDFLWPRRVIPGDEGSEPNNASVVAVVRTPSLSVLLTGDVEPEAQRALRTAVAAEVGAQGVDVLKVPHHGSAHQDLGFLAAAGARVAVISVGLGNDYGHPAPVTLSALQTLGLLVRRTDEDGGVAVLRRDGQLLVSTSKPPP